MTPANSTPDGGFGRISDVLGRLRVLIGRRVISRVAIANVVPGADLSAIDVLAVIRSTRRVDGDVQGTTVGAVAQAMRIDPSRASRLVSQMVDRGLLARVASQEDARSCLLVHTELGHRLHQEMRQVKLRLICSALEDWDPDEIEIFASQFERFIVAWERQIDADDQSISPERGGSH